MMIACVRKHHVLQSHRLGHYRYAGQSRKTLSAFNMVSFLSTPPCKRNIATRVVFTSVANLRTKLMRYIRHYNKTATPIRWTYSDPSKRIKA